MAVKAKATSKSSSKTQKSTKPASSTSASTGGSSSPWCDALCFWDSSGNCASSCNSVGNAGNAINGLSGVDWKDIGIRILFVGGGIILVIVGFIKIFDIQAIPVPV